jgi:formylmethanofuran dehydrogenase subunit E
MAHLSASAWPMPPRRSALARQVRAPDSDRTMPPIIRFIGKSGSGKTTLLAEVVRLLGAEGMRVAAFKQAHHRVDLDRKGKDSFRFAAAGAAFVTVVSPDKLATFEACESRPDLLELASRVGVDVDVLLAEGFHDVATPYFLVLAPGQDDDRSPEREPGERLGVIARGGRAVGSASVASDAAEAARRIISWLRAQDHREVELERALREADAFHGHLCPGQVLGVRMALLGCRSAGVADPRGSKKLITWVEIDRCGADAVQTVTGCKPGKRTLKIVDYGKLAATFLNTETGVAIRVVVRSDARERAVALHPQLERHDAQMAAYRTLPEDQLFTVQAVSPALGAFDRPGKPAMRVLCTVCGEEVNDNRHIDGDDGPLCRACAGGAYYAPVSARAEAPAPW